MQQAELNRQPHAAEDTPNTDAGGAPRSRGSGPSASPLRRALFRLRRNRLAMLGFWALGSCCTAAPCSPTSWRRITTPAAPARRRITRR